MNKFNLDFYKDKYVMKYTLPWSKYLGLTGIAAAELI